MSDFRSLLIDEAAESASVCEVKAGLDLYTLTGETSKQLDDLARRHSSAAQETIRGYLSQLGAAPAGEDLDDLWTREEEDVERYRSYRFCVDKFAELKDTEYVATSLMPRDKAWSKLSEASYENMVRKVKEDGSSPSVASLVTDEGDGDSRGALMRRDSSSAPDESAVPELV